MLFILPIMGLGRKLKGAMDGDIALIIACSMSVLLMLLSVVMIKSQFKHCSFFGKHKVAAGETTGFWQS